MLLTWRNDNFCRKTKNLGSVHTYCKTKRGGNGSPLSLHFGIMGRVLCIGRSESPIFPNHPSNPWMAPNMCH